MKLHDALHDSRAIHYCLSSLRR